VKVSKVTQALAHIANGIAPRWYFRLLFALSTNFIYFTNWC